jgi:NADPH:quinone reductase-like Zn-dependent oxidoreductase
MKRWMLAFAAAIATGEVTTPAHHSISSVYDSSRRVTIEGTVAQFQLINPHPFLFIDVTDATGKVQQWRLEMDNRFELVSIGVTANTFKAGDRVVVTGTLARGSSNGLYVWRLDRPADGFWYEQVGSSPRIAKTP